MAVKNNPVLGTIACDCGDTATVHQTSRGKGRFFYTRCPKCGVDQRTGPAVQKRLWEKTDWREGVEKVKPPGIDASDDWQPPTTIEKEPEVKKEQSEKKPKAKPAPAESSGAAGAVLGLGLLAGALALGAAVWKKGAAAPVKTNQPAGVKFDERFL